MSDPRAEIDEDRRIAITAPGLWAVVEDRMGLKAYRLDWSRSGLAYKVEDLPRLELMLLETRLRYALDCVRGHLRAQESQP